MDDGYMGNYRNGPNGAYCANGRPIGMSTLTAPLLSLVNVIIGAAKISIDRIDRRIGLGVRS